MKKTLVALAALATLSGAAFAQSTVTLYGKIDWTLQNQTQKIGGVKTATGNVGAQLSSAGLSGSRWGMKGSEDLGGGMKAIFDLQAGFTIDDALLAQGGRQFGRQAYAGLAGNWGQITAGRQYSPIDTAWGNFDAQGYTTNSAMGYAWNRPGNALGNNVHAEPGRIDNSIDYKTPTMSGFTGELMYAPGENKIPGVQSAGSYAGFLIGYINGPIGVQLAYERIEGGLNVGNQTGVGGGAIAGTNQFTGVTPGGVPTNASVRDWFIGASYDLGVAKLFGGYQRASATGGLDDKGWMLGTAVPIGPMTLQLSYARETTDVNTNFDGKASAFGGQLVYPLSKRTNVYVDFLSGKTRGPGLVAQAATQKNEVYGVGMRHDF